MLSNFTMKYYYSNLLTSHYIF